MEQVGTLPETNDVLSPTIIPLFGILSPPAEQEEECHFCLESRNHHKRTIYDIQTAVLRTAGHHTRTECFKTWASHSHTESTVRCAYCTTIYQYEDTCFLCLQEYTEKLMQLYNVLPHESSHRMHNRPHNSSLAPNLRPHTGMRTTH